MILRKIIKIVATRCQILRLQCTKFDFGWGSAPDPAGGAYSAPPDPIAGFKGPTSKGKEEGREGEGKGRGNGGKREGEGKGRKGREKGGTPLQLTPPPVKKSWIRAWLTSCWILSAMSPEIQEWSHECRSRIKITFIYFHAHSILIIKLELLTCAVLHNNCSIMVTWT